MNNKIDFINTPVADSVNKVIIDAVKKGVSDIHFDPSEDGVIIRFRADGVLEDYATIPEVVKQNVITRVKIISGMNITETRLPQDGGIKTTLEDMELDMRVSALPTK